MVPRAAEKKHQIIDSIITLATERLPADKATTAIAFIRRYYSHVSLEDLLGQDIKDLYGAALSHLRLADQRQAETGLVRAYNPGFDEHGWQSTHTIIDIVVDDMPFLVDSVVMELNRQGLRVHVIIHPVLHVIRRAGELTGLAADTAVGHKSAAEHDGDGEAICRESFIHCQIDRQTDADALRALQQALLKILTDVRISVEDWPAMCSRMQTVIAQLKSDKLPCTDAETEEIKAFLSWAADHHFIFLGYREYDLVKENDAVFLRTVANSGLGVLRDDGTGRISPSFTELPERLRQLATEPMVLIVSKSGQHSSVHRPAYMDYIGVKRFDDDGNVIGEYRFLGLYTSEAYNRLPSDIPLLRKKIEEVIKRSGVAPETHDRKTLQNILNNFPRDELIQIAEEDLFNTVMGILELQERQRLKLFLYQDMFERFVSCLVYVPRERYTTDLRMRMEAILIDELNGTSSTFATQFSESVLARVQFHIRTLPGKVPELSETAVIELESHLRQAMLSWKDKLHRALIDANGEAQGNHLYHRYADAFPAAYMEDFNARSAIGDASRLEKILATDTGEHALAMHLYRSLEDSSGLMHFKVYGRGEPMPLSDALPILERMGLRVLTARPYELALSDGRRCWVLTFDMQEESGYEIDVGEVRTAFQEAFARVWHRHMENDGYNRLVLSARLPWRDVAMLRAYSKYLLQARIPFSHEYMQQALTQHPDIARQLVALFHLRFDPHQREKRAANTDTLTAQIETSLEQVGSLDEDRILRRFLALIQATMRTNYFQKNGDHQAKDYLSFKLDPGKIPELPRPLPMHEIFVYSPRVEAVHLRGGPVARGGLRWSDRREDFRTEVLGLMKAQTVKNSVIVPVGAKGGFVIKQPPLSSDREALQQEVQACYSTFIRGMLDITDNRDGEHILPPVDVVRHDADDPYLVVAADKGTATFSDLANGIALQYGFWLGDAFASGGSNGYDHKGMGITARGAWESVKRHFREMGKDIQNENFTVVGIGDMSGDVFGNGMLLSRHIQLLAAFNHLHIFLDPAPDPEASFQERERLFTLPRSTWGDYNADLLSPGGGVFSRSAKSIGLSAEIRAVLGINETRLTPNELINHILKAPVELLWNGGIGTYVKASSETHQDADDRTNDAVRVNGDELRCKVIGEGGNLGCTQSGRIEFALNGGRILTDAIDNSAGVNCSDHEVNIKILLNHIVDAGDMTQKQRNGLLAEMTDEVAELVLRQNYLQPETISITYSRAAELLGEHSRVIRYLERIGNLDRAMESLPDDDEISEREAAGKGLVPPELAVLLAYSKINLFDELIASDVPEDSFLQRELSAYFPQPLQERFAEQISSHALRREIIATYITNSVLNRMGSGYVIRLIEDSGESVPDIARAYSAARAIFNARQLWRNIDSLDNQVNAALQMEMHMEIRRLLERASLWLLRNRRAPLAIEATVTQFAGGVETLTAALPALLSEEPKTAFEQERNTLAAAGVPDDVAHTMACLKPLYAALDIVDVAIQTELAAEDVAAVYFGLAESLEMAWLITHIAALPSTSHWQRRAKAALLTGIFDQGRLLTANVLHLTSDDSPPRERLVKWQIHNQTTINRMQNMLADLKAVGQAPDLAMLSVALREMSNLVPAS